MRIVVTGTQGQVVQSLVERAEGQTDVTIVPVGRPELDLTELDRIEPTLAAARPDTIINAAAYTAVDQAESEPELAQLINSEAPGRVAAAAGRLGVPLLHISTDYVFDGSLERPYKETDPVAPLGVYGHTKLGGERAVSAATDNYVILRTAWVYSPFGKNFVKTMLRLGETRDHVRVVADQRGSPTSAVDIADALLTIARRLIDEPTNEHLLGVFHMTGSGEATWAELARTLFQEAERHGRPPVRVEAITTAEYPTPASRPVNSRLDSSSLETVYGVRLPHWPASTCSCVARLLGVGA
jgi:dTDP-4-dehydrorhamnose reductase